MGAQLIPAGTLAIVPVPAPARLTVSATALVLKLAVTSWLAVSVMVHVGLVLQPPPVHPANVEFAPAVAVSVT